MSRIRKRVLAFLVLAVLAWLGAGAIAGYCATRAFPAPIPNEFALDGVGNGELERHSTGRQFHRASRLAFGLEIGLVLVNSQRLDVQ